MNRADRRKQRRRDASDKKAELKRAGDEYQRDLKRSGFDPDKGLRNSAYMAHYIHHELVKQKELEKNGITESNLKAEYQRGWDDAQKQLTGHQMRFFYAALSIAAHSLFRFGEKRICRMFGEINRIMIEELTSSDIIARCKKETGVEIDAVDDFF